MNLSTRVALSIAVGFAATTQTRAQSNTALPPKLEVASIKRNTSDLRGPFSIGLSFFEGGRVTGKNQPLWEVIRSAYRIDRFRLFGGPDWVESERYNIEANAEANAIPPGPLDRASVRQLQLMMQRLLEDRFKLKMHREIRELPVYELVVAKDGAKLRKADDQACTGGDTSCHNFGGGPASGLNGKSVEISTVAQVLTAFLERGVIDRTGLEGTFDIHLPPWSRGSEAATRAVDEGREPAPDPNGPSIFTVIRELGLRLESRKAPVEVLVIDYAEKPSEN